MSRGREAVIAVLLGSILVTMFVFGMRFDALEHRADQNIIELKQSIQDLRTEFQALESKVADLNGRAQGLEAAPITTQQALTHVTSEVEQLRRVVRRLQSRDF